MVLAILAKLGLHQSTTIGHLSPPSTSMVALGILFDLESNTVELPQDKLETTLAMLVTWRGRTTATKRQLQQLLGKLLHASHVIRPGRLHLTRMLDNLRRAGGLDQPMLLDGHFRADVEWWLDNMSSWNGVSILVFSSHHNKVALDASSNGWTDGGPGLGGYNFVTNEYFKCGVPQNMSNWHINELELLAHLICARLWGESFRGQEVWGLTDNEACEWFLRIGRSRTGLCIQMGRTFTSLQHRMGFLWVPGPVRSTENVLPNCCSRFGDLERRRTFWTTVASMGVTPTERHVVPEMFNIVSV
jgi:hypothetical protein